MVGSSKHAALMPVEFHTEANPSEKLCREVASLAPANPYYTFEYIEAKRALGFQPWMLLLRANGQLLSGCPAFVKTGFLARSLEIESLPTIPDADVFWNELQTFCRSSGISGLGVYTAASDSARIPPLPGEIWRKTRCEFVIELRKGDLWRLMRNSHRGRVNRSRKAGVTVGRTGGAQAWQEHARAVEASMERRKTRGEIFPEVKQAQFCEALRQSRQGELFQAFRDGRVLSSAFVIKAERGAYYFWAGTTAEGMTLGASHYLVHEIAKIMQEESLDFFNLGGTGLENKGLIEFKRGFGPREVTLEAAEFCFGSRVKRGLGRAFQILRNDPARLLRRGIDHLTRLKPVEQS
jgi:hypothetical protein